MTKTYYQLEDENGDVLYQGYNRAELISKAEDDIAQDMADDGEEGTREEIAFMSIINEETGDTIEKEDVLLVASHRNFNARDEWGTY